MPKLISDARFRRLVEDQKRLRILEVQKDELPARTFEAINQRLAMLELAVVQLARVLNPSVTDVESALRTAEKFGRKG
jgi:hypothetical protein